VGCATPLAVAITGEVLCGCCSSKSAFKKV
jgi:hypothetical protein